MNHFKGVTPDPRPVKIEMSRWGANELLAAIRTVQLEHPYTELAQVLQWFKAALGAAGAVQESNRTLSTENKYEPIDPI